MSSSAGEVSVIVVSRGRPSHLSLCLTALSQQICDPFEVIVVADASGVTAVQRSGFGSRVKLHEFDDANISAARNIGLQHASGKIVAFIDDDAAAEPTWLSALVAPFDAHKVVASTGYVRGRNGVCFQSKGQSVDEIGVTKDLCHQGDDVFFPDVGLGRAVKTVGTNCAFRKDVLLSLGGFDEAFRFYLEDADVNFRLRKLGRTAIVPLAQVHHSFAASDRRRADRAPRTLFEVGRSSAIFLRKHAPDKVDAGRNALEDEQRARLLRYMVAGQLLPSDVNGLFRGLLLGWRDGMTVPVPSHLPEQFSVSKRFHEFVTETSRRLSSHAFGLQVRVLNRRVFQMGSTTTKGARTIFAYDMSPRPLRVSYSEAGTWVHRGGLWGRVARDAPRLSFIGYRQRVADEIRRIEELRGLSHSNVNVL